jgi:hypothetical protein
MPQSRAQSGRGTIQRRADMALVVFAGGASCAARWAIGANQGRLALVIVTGASTSCRVALRRHLLSRMLARRRPTPSCPPAPRWCASVRLASCQTAVASVWSLVQLPRVASGRLGRCPIGCDLHQPSRVEGSSCCCPQGEQLEAWSTRASGRRGGGDQGLGAMIASTISEQFVTVDGSRNYAQEGDMRLLASGDAGGSCHWQHRRERGW